VLAVSAAAVLAGARSVTAIAEWAADAPGPVLAALGVRSDPLTRRCHVPGEATIRRVLARVGGDAVDATVGAWLAERLRPLRHRRVLAVDGKSVCGTASGGHDRPVHLLTVIDHSDGAVLAQREINATTNEISQFQPLLVGLDFTGAVVTAGAMHTQRGHASFLVDRGAGYLLVVKANRPGLHAQLAGLPWRQIPVMDRTRDHGHGRVGTLKVAAVAGLCFPHAAQAIQVTRRVRMPGSRRWRTVTVYAVTSLALGAASPAQLGGWLRGHWRIENRLRWVRDVTWGEDASTARTGSLPRVMASLRNLAVGAVRLARPPNLTAAQWRANPHGRVPAGSAMDGGAGRRRCPSALGRSHGSAPGPASVLSRDGSGRPIAEVAEALGISAQSISTWRRQDRIERGLVPGLTSAEKAELGAAKRRSAELETKAARDATRDRAGPAWCGATWAGR
jgi:predicted transposase YbfD/YdcC